MRNPGAKLRWGLLLLAVSCATPPPAIPPPPVGEPPAPLGAPAVRFEPSPEPTPTVPPSPLPLAPGLDLDHWPFGWVVDDQAPRLGLAPRFWTDQRLRWTEALDPRTPASRVARLLGLAFAGARSPEEALRAAWRLRLTYASAGLVDEARLWLDRAVDLAPGAEGPALDRVWDQVVRLGDVQGGLALWPSSGFSRVAGDEARKLRLLRQRLFLGSLSFAPTGADDYVAALALDRDDLWAGTWNGSVVRYSLVTGALDRILAADAVSPVNRLVVTGWFVYAFQDQSLLRYSKVTGTWRTFPYPPGWSGLRVTGVVADGEQALWVAHLGQGLWRWDQGQWTLADGAGGGPFLTALASDGLGGLWVGTKDRGLWNWAGGQWAPVPSVGEAPDNVSTVVGDSSGTRWAVGTWGEGAWLLQDGTLVPAWPGRDYVDAAAWSGDNPLWGTVDGGLVDGRGRVAVGPLDGLPAGGVSSLAVWEGRWIWGTMGQGLGWWRENENPALLR